jgi:hypothetical protein
VLFLLAQVGAGLVADHLCPQVRFAFLYRQLAKAQACPQPLAIVCLGSSRTGTCLVDDELTCVLRENCGPEPVQVFNAAMPVGDLVVSEHVLDRLLRRGVRPRLLVVEVMPEFLNRHNGWLSHHVDRQLRWKDLPSYRDDLCRADLMSQFLIGRLAPLYAERKGYWDLLGEAGATLLGIHKEPERALLSSTALWNRVIQATPDLSAAEKQARKAGGLQDARACLRDYAPGGNSAAALERIMVRCRRKKIQVILLAVPVCSEHRQLYDPAIEQAFGREMRRLVERFDCRFVDCRARIADAHFLDNHHADGAGGLAFSKQFCEEVLVPVWRQIVPIVRGEETKKAKSPGLGRQARILATCAKGGRRELND